MSKLQNTKKFILVSISNAKQRLHIFNAFPDLPTTHHLTLHFSNVLQNLIVTHKIRENDGIRCVLMQQDINYAVSVSNNLITVQFLLWKGDITVQCQFAMPMCNSNTSWCIDCTHLTIQLLQLKANLKYQKSLLFCILKKSWYLYHTAV